MSRYYSLETIRANAYDVMLANGAKHRCIDPDALLDIEPADVRENVKAEKVISKHAVDDITTRWFECDVCGQAVDLMDNFCKNCGASFVP